MAYAFVPSHHDLGKAAGPRLAMAWHFAEGGGTVGFLSRPNTHGVSVHFVVERTGRIVQMLALGHMHTSLRVSAIRTSDDPPYDWNGTPIVYGAAAAGAVMRSWASNPNNASIGVEIEGFARDGPNPAQTESIAELWADMSSEYPGVRSLGHRDWADYKACPGKKFPWDLVGGHGIDTGEDVKFIQASGLAAAPSTKALRLRVGTPLYGFDGKQVTTMSAAADVPYVGLVDAHTGQYVVRVATGKVYDDGTTRPTLLVARVGTLVDIPATSPADCADAVATAVHDIKTTARIVFG